MREVEQKIYKFEELGDKAKERVLCKSAEDNCEYDWWNWIFEDTKEQCAEIGVTFDAEDLNFDLGRGACFYILSENLHFTWKSVIELPYKFGTYQNYLGGGMRGGIQSEYISEERIDFVEGEDLEGILRTLARIQEIFEDGLSRLHKEYEVIQSKEYILEHIESNDCEFTEEGNIYCE